jgi:methyl-accepting chemotaxis protein
MVADTTNASRELSGEADMLMTLVEQFRLEQSNAPRQVSRAA